MFLNLAAGIALLLGSLLAYGLAERHSHHDHCDL